MSLRNSDCWSSGKRSGLTKYPDSAGTEKAGHPPYCLVGMLTYLDDLQCIQKEHEIVERAEEAEGILDSQESDKLSFNEKSA